MNKYFTRGLIATFVIAIVFIFSAVVFVTPASAVTNTTLCKTVESLISAGVIEASQANSSRTAAGCPLPAVPQICSTIELLINMGIVKPEKASLARSAFGCPAQSDPIIVPVEIPTIMVSSPSSGVIWQKDSTQNIIWQLPAQICPAGSNCVSPAPEPYDIYIVTYNTGLTRKIASQVEGFVYSWRISDSTGGLGTYYTPGNYQIKVCGAISNSCRTSSNYFVITASETPSQVDASVTINGTPTLSLSYSDEKESQLLATFNVSVTAGDHDMSIRNDIAGVSLYNQTGQPVSSNSSRINVQIIQGGYNNGVLTGIRAGGTVNLVVTLKAKPSELFAGIYYVSLRELYSAGERDSTAISTIPVPSNKTVYQYIIGETSPYITSAVFVPGIISGFDGVRIQGTRLSSLQLASIRCSNSSAILSKPNYSQLFSNGNTASFVFTDTAPSGSCDIQITDPNTGASNFAPFNVSGGSGTQPSITVISPNGGEVFKNSGRLMVTWKSVKGDFPGMKLELLKSSGEIVSFVNINAVSGVNNSDALSLDNVSPGKYVIRACLNGNVDICDKSDNYFTVTSAVKPPVSNGYPDYYYGDSSKGGLYGNCYPAYGKDSYYGNWVRSKLEIVEAAINKTSAHSSANITQIKVLSCSPFDGPGDSFIVNCPAGQNYSYCVRNQNDGLANSVLLGVTETVPVVSQTCTSFNYSSWGNCVNGVQTRAVVSSSPTNCTGGNPVLTLSCDNPVITYTVSYDGNGNTGGQVPTAINAYPSGTSFNIPDNTGNLSKTGYIFNGWSAGLGNVHVYTPGDTYMIGSNNVIFYAQWISVPVTPITCTSFNYSSWSTCGTDESSGRGSFTGVQTRTVTSSSPSGCVDGSPVLTQSCDLNVEKQFSQTFGGVVAGSRVFDLGKLVSIKSININWTDNMQSCRGQVAVSIDSGNWREVSPLVDVPTPGSLPLSGIGDARYIRLSAANCPSYIVSSMNVSGTYVERVTLGGGNNYAAAVASWESILRLIEALR